MENYILIYTRKCGKPKPENQKPKTKKQNK